MKYSFRQYIFSRNLILSFEWFWKTISIDLSDIEVDSGGVTEEGTTQMYIDGNLAKLVNGYVVWFVLGVFLHIERLLIVKYIVKKMSFCGTMVSL